MTKFFNSHKRNLENKKKQAVKYGHSQTPKAIYLRERRASERRIKYYAIQPKIKYAAAGSKLAELLVAETTPIADTEVLKKMYEPDEVDNLIRSLHIKYLNEHESNE